jgi:L-alanine-DL-glutamate epimerase-like enolase superfamily enzyme
MKIREIEAIPVDVPRSPTTRIASSYSALPSAKFVLVVVRTDDGVEGLGEASPEYQWTGEDDRSCMSAINTYLAPTLAGRDPLRIQDNLAAMNAILAYNPYAKSAIEMALWDIAGKVSGLALADLWGGRVRDSVPIKFVVSGAPERAADLAVKLVDSGFRYIKIKTGLGVESDIARVAAVRKALPDSIPIGVDANMGWSLGEAYRILPALEEMGVSFIEQPINRHPIEALVEFRNRSTIPLVAHESLFTLNDALELLTRRAVDMWAITPGTHAGYLPTREILSLARAGSISCLLGSTLELGVNSAFMAQIGLSAPSIDGTVPSDIIGPFYHERDIIKERFTVVDGGIVPPHGLGLGVSLDWDAIKQFRTDGK